MNYACPFCRLPCAVGDDCTCGARAVSCAPEPETRPLMAHPSLDDGSIVMLTLGNILTDNLREMIRIP